MEKDLITSQYKDVDINLYVRSNNNVLNYNDYIINTINNLNPELVVDVGCGHNKYKNLIQNLIGFDSADYSEIDFKATIFEASFDNESVDAIISTGSIQHLSNKCIKDSVSKICSWVKPGGLIFMKVNFWEDNFCNLLKFTNNKLKIIPWKMELLEEITTQNNLKFFKQPSFENWSFATTDPGKRITDILTGTKKEEWEFMSNNLKKLTWVSQK